MSYDVLYATLARDPTLRGVEEWRLIVEAVHSEARRHLTAGRSVIVDNLNEDRVDRGQLRDIADDCGATAVVVHVDTPIELCKERRRRNEETGTRGHTMREDFEFVRARFEPPGLDERSIVIRPDDDFELWLERLRALL